MQLAVTSIFHAHPMPNLCLTIRISTNSRSDSVECLLNPHSWQLSPHQRLLASPTILFAGSEVWIESTVWEILPVVMGFRCVSVRSAGQIEFCSIHGPIKVAKVEAILDGENIHIQGDLDLPPMINQVPCGRWVYRLFINNLLGHSMLLKNAPSPRRNHDR